MQGHEIPIYFYIVKQWSTGIQNLKTVSFTIATKSNIPSIKITKYAQTWYAEN